MKIFAAGDIHGDTSLAERLAKKAKDEKADLVIICGDITHFEESTDNLIGPFKKQDLKVLIVPGNHESLATVDFLAEMYEIQNLHGYSIQHSDVGIFGAGGSTVVGPVPPMQDKEMFSLLEKGHKEVSHLSKTVMVTHEHPTGSKMESFTQHFPGSKSIRKAVEYLNPDFLLCAHVHEAEGLEETIGKTKVINVGKQGTFIDL